MIYAIIIITLFSIIISIKNNITYGLYVFIFLILYAIIIKIFPKL